MQDILYWNVTSFPKKRPHLHGFFGTFRGKASGDLPRLGREKEMFVAEWELYLTPFLGTGRISLYQFWNDSLAGGLLE